VDCRIRIVLSARFSAAMSSIQAWIAEAVRSVTLANRPSRLRMNTQKLLQVPSVRSHASFRLAALLALEVAELLDQLRERLGHVLGPPARATTTFSLSGSIGGDHPAVKAHSGGIERRERVTRSVTLGGHASSLLRS